MHAWLLCDFKKIQRNGKEDWVEKTQEFHTVETKWEERHQEKTQASGGV